MVSSVLLCAISLTIVSFQATTTAFSCLKMWAELVEALAIKAVLNTLTIATLVNKVNVESKRYLLLSLLRW